MKKYFHAFSDTWHGPRHHSARRFINLSYKLVHQTSMPNEDSRRCEGTKFANCFSREEAYGNTLRTEHIGVQRKWAHTKNITAREVVSIHRRCCWGWFEVLKNSVGIMDVSNDDIVGMPRIYPIFLQKFRGTQESRAQMMRSYANHD